MNVAFVLHPVSHLLYVPLHRIVAELICHVLYPSYEQGPSVCFVCFYYFGINTAVFRSSLRWDPEWLLIVPFDPEPHSEWLKSWTGGLRVPPCTLKSIHLFLLLAAGHHLLKSQTTPPIYSSSITSLASPRFSRQPSLYMPTVPALPVFPPFPCQSAW